MRNNFLSLFEVSLQFYLLGMTSKYLSVKLSLCLTKHHAVKTYWGVEVQRHTFLTAALEGDEWSDSRPGRFTPGERVPSSHWIGSWGGTRAGLDGVVKRQIPSPRRESTPPPPRTPIRQPVSSRYTILFGVSEGINLRYLKRNRCITS
jgi:hypothetical protein